MRKTIMTVAALVALAVPAATQAGKTPRAAHVTASADFVWVDNCAALGAPTPRGHLEVDAWDDDPSAILDPGTPQADRVSITVTRADGSTWTPHGIGVRITENGEAQIGVDSWWTFWTIHDGGTPGTALTGALFNGVAETSDWAQFQGVSMCGRGKYFLTSGNIKITR